LARGAAWSVFGFFLGLSEGIRRFSLKGTRNAAVGGFLGGLIGGILFDVVGIFIGYIGGGTFSRGVGLATLGACIGILIALVERALAEAMLFVVQGRQEGRTILLDKPRMIVGRVETNDIYLSDAGIEPRHAEIRAEGRGYAIAPLRGTVLVNQAAVTHHVLQYDDEIQLGNARLRYRARRSAVRVPERVPARADEPPPYIQPSPPRPPAKDQLTMCPRCAHTNRGEAKFCARCGQGLM
jgi:hypothetical protein